MNGWMDGRRDGSLHNKNVRTGVFCFPSLGESPYFSSDKKIKNKYLYMIQNKAKALVSPAFDKTTWASIDLLIFEEQTVPKESLEGIRRDLAGGKPGGVEGRWRPGTND